VLAVAAVYESAHFEASMSGLEASYAEPLRACLLEARAAVNEIETKNFRELIWLANETDPDGGGCLESTGLAAQLEDPRPPAAPPAP